MEELLKMKIQDEFRPIVSVNTDGGEIACLIDTGANISVFTLGIENIRDYFPDVELIYRYKVQLGGFGKGETEAILCRIKRIKISSDIGDYSYINLENIYVACCNRADMGAGLILSSGIFDELGLYINRKICEVHIGHDRTTYNGTFRLDSHKEKVVRTSVYSQYE